jgi:flagellin
MLQRQRELAVQSLNGTYNKENRAQMNTEFQQLTKEINRVGTTTKFNSVDLMAHMSTTGSVLSTAASANFQQIGWQVAGQTGSRNKLAVSKFNFTTNYSGSLGTGNVFGTFYFVSTNGTKVLSAKGNSYGAQGISTQASASVAVMRIDSALSNIGTVRAKWGAFQNRLEYTVSNLQNVDTNIQAARSRIQDTDYARESANLARTQVLQQAGMSMLSQSNQSGQNVMSLLR